MRKRRGITLELVAAKGTRAWRPESWLCGLQAVSLMC